MADKHVREERRLGTRYVLGMLLLVSAVAVLVIVGERFLPGPSDALSTPSVVVALLVLYLVILLIRLPYTLWWPNSRARRLPFGSIPELENELDGFIYDFIFNARSYQDELTRYQREQENAGEADQSALIRTAREELEQIDRNLKTALWRLDRGRYVGSFRQYYLAQRDLVEVAPALVLVDRAHGLRRNRLFELVDQCQAMAAQLTNVETRRTVESHLGEYEQRDPTGDPTDVDLSPLKSAFREIHTTRLQSLTDYLRLRRLLTWLNLSLALSVAAVLLTSAALTLPVVFANNFDFTAIPESVSSVLMVVVVLFFGGFGAVLNILRRFGGTAVFGEAPALPELPNDIVMRQVLRARVLWGAAAALIVYVFTLLSGRVDLWALVLTAVAAGFSEQWLDKIFERQQANLFGPQPPDDRNRNDERTDQYTSADTPPAGNT